MRLTRPLALVASLALHATLVVPRLVSWEPPEAPPLELEAEEGEEEAGDLPVEPLPDVPFRVSVYQDPALAAAAPADAPPAAAPPAADPAPKADDPAILALPAPPPEPPAPAPAPAPVAQEPPPPEPVLTDVDRAALAGMERGEATADTPTDDDDGDAVEQVATRHEGRRARRVHTAHHPKRPPCPEPVAEIARVADAHWFIDRDLIEFYATNLIELQKLGAVWTHRDDAGRLDGFRVGLARCSVLRQGGLRSGDVVHDINGRRINTVLQAVAAYFALRSEPELRVHITRRGTPLELAYTIEQPNRRRGRHARR